MHAGSASFYDWADYHAICLATWKGEAGHKKPHEFQVQITEEKHPVTCGCDDFRTLDELWYKPFVESKATVLAESYSRHTEE